MPEHKVIYHTLTRLRIMPRHKVLYHTHLDFASWDMSVAVLARKYH